EGRAAQRRGDQARECHEDQGKGRGKARNFVSPKRKGDASMARMEDVPVAGKDCDAAADRANLAVPLAGRVLHGLEAGARARLADGAKPAARGLERRAEV